MKKERIFVFKILHLAYKWLHFYWEAASSFLHSVTFITV